MYIFNRAFLTISFAILICSCSFAQENQSIELKNTGEVSYVNLKPDYSYYLFYANQDFLVWYEGYTSTLYICNLKQENINIVELKEGSGPHEFKQVSGLYISDQ
jgi:hypothetical protein